MSKDYSYLEGKTFQFYNGHETVTAKVVAADYHIGITCVNAADPDDYLICFKGPSSPGYIKQNIKAHQYS